VAPSPAPWLRVSVTRGVMTDMLARPPFQFTELRRANDLKEGLMPRISSFYGIVITMYWKEHGVPHFHVRAAEFEATVAIDTLELLGGTLPTRALRLVGEWASLHRGELHDNWRRARARRPLVEIDPLP
jgi:hypothetical protein